MKKISLAILTFTCILAFGFNNFTESQQAKPSKMGYREIRNTF
ncbi:hypothetical protein [Bacillus cereus]|nr:hypothetical protein [Bacillus cereus]MDF9507899.1 hypothetical protein [Bacillus cereus]